MQNEKDGIHVTLRQRIALMKESNLVIDLSRNNFFL